jgi:DUF1680 family protein
MLDMPMKIQLIEGHPRIEEVRNQVAIKRGPVVYCIESADLPGGTDILDVYLPGDSELQAEYQQEAPLQRDRDPQGLVLGGGS